MGYRPPPMPGSTIIHRGWWARRTFLNQIPGPDSSLWMLGGPGKRMELGVAMQVVPHRDRWEWRVWLTFNGGKGLAGWTNAGWRNPTPHEIRGRCKNQGDAWIAARSIADEVRARVAHQEVQRGQRHTERLPL